MEKERDTETERGREREKVNAKRIEQANLILMCDV